MARAARRSIAAIERPCRTDPADPASCPTPHTSRGQRPRIQRDFPVNTMNAIQIDRFGDPSVLRPVVIERPTPAPDEVLVRVTRVGLNFAETLQRAGIYPGPAPALPAILGSETVGTVEAVGANVRDFRVGERVAAALFGATSGTGGYAE